MTQPSQKGPTCGYYALLPLRVRIGPEHPPSAEKQRSIEQLISLWRKQITHFSRAHYRPGPLQDDYLIGLGECDENLLRTFKINPLHMLIDNMGHAELWNSSSPIIQAKMMSDAQINWDALSPIRKSGAISNFSCHAMVVN